MWPYFVKLSADHHLFSNIIYWVKIPFSAGLLPAVDFFFFFFLICCFRSGSFPGGSVGKECTCNTGDPGLIPGSRKSPGEGNGNPLQYSCLENPMDRGVWQATVHGVTRVGPNLVPKPPCSGQEQMQNLDVLLLPSWPQVGKRTGQPGGPPHLSPLSGPCLLRPGSPD